MSFSPIYRVFVSFFFNDVVKERRNFFFILVYTVCSVYLKCGQYALVYRQFAFLRKRFWTFIQFLSRFEIKNFRLLYYIISHHLSTEYGVSIVQMPHKKIEPDLPSFLWPSVTPYKVYANCEGTKLMGFHVCYNIVTRGSVFYFISIKPLKTFWVFYFVSRKSNSGH